MTASEIYVLRDGQQVGPFPEQSLSAMLDQGNFQLTDLGWHDQLIEWTPLHVILNRRPPIQVNQPASMIQRLCSASIDIGVLFLAIVIGWSLLIYQLGKEVNPDADPTLGEVLAPHWMLFWSIPVLLMWLYFVPAECSAAQASFGKRIVGLKVIGLDGSTLTFGRGTWRVAGRILSALTLGVGVLMGAWTRNRQCLHDIVSGSIVVRRK